MVKLRAQGIDMRCNMIHIKVAKGREDRQRFILTSAGWISDGLRALWILEADEALRRVAYKQNTSQNMQI